jgi:hypothetical protein
MRARWSLARALPAHHQEAEAEQSERWQTVKKMKNYRRRHSRRERGAKGFQTQAQSDA